MFLLCSLGEAALRAREGDFLSLRLVGLRGESRKIRIKCNVAAAAQSSKWELGNPNSRAARPAFVCSNLKFKNAPPNSLDIIIQSRRSKLPDPNATRPDPTRLPAASSLSAPDMAAVVVPAEEAQRASVQEDAINYVTCLNTKTTAGHEVGAREESKSRGGRGKAKEKTRPNERKHEFWQIEAARLLLASAGV